MLGVVYLVCELLKMIVVFFFNVVIFMLVNLILGN